MMTAIFVIIELIFLYFLSKRVIQAIYTLIYTLFHSRPVGLSIVSLIFFPGTVIHELSHLFVAEIVGVRTGKLTLVPESMEGEEVRAGSVAISKTDPLRRTLIGVSPILVGIVTLGVLTHIYSTQFVNNITITIIYYYLIFSISNSMFSSKEDMKGAVPVFIVLGLVATAAYMVGLRAELTGDILTAAKNIMDVLFRSMTLVLALNAIILLLFSVLVDLIRRISRA